MKITELLNIKYPILQGAMAHVSHSSLVAAVSNAGGLGILASGGLSAAELRAEIRQCKQLTDKSFAVNLMLVVENCDELIDVIIDEGVKILTTGAGTPKLYMAKLKAAGIKVIPVVPSVAIARKMEELGVDAVIAEGTEAGGHVGETTTLVLVPQVVDAVSIPVLAAGGIADGRGIAAAYALGAQGVQIGTLFMAATECPIPDSVKQALIATCDTDTVVTGRAGGVPIRSIKNKMIKLYLQWENENVPRDLLEKLTMGSLRKAVYEGDTQNGSIMAGQACSMIKKIRPAKEIIETLMADAKKVAATITIE